MGSALEVSTDDLLRAEASRHISAYNAEIASILEDCSPRDMRIMAEMIRAMKQIMEKYM